MVHGETRSAQRWATPQDCAQCRARMQWIEQTQHSVFEKADVEELGIGGVPLSELGLPSVGAMFVARTGGKLPLRLLLD